MTHHYYPEELEDAALVADCESRAARRRQRALALLCLLAAALLLLRLPA